MMRANVLLIIALLALIAIAASEHSRPNSGLPLVNAAVPMFPPSPTCRLYTTYPIDHRNVPILEERSA
jgi:hypothetical protein